VSAHHPAPRQEKPESVEEARDLELVVTPQDARRENAMEQAKRRWWGPVDQSSDLSTTWWTPSSTLNVSAKRRTS